VTRTAPTIATSQPARPRCAGCGSEQSTVRYDFGAQQIRRCAGCRLLYLHPLPSEQETREVYGEAYFRNAQLLAGGNEGLFGYADYVAERFNKQPQYARIAREIRSLLPADVEQPRLLEVGCGFGYFLDVAFEEGFAVSGLEFNPHAVERLHRKYAFPIACGALETARLPWAGLDAAVMFDVIEHLRDPFTALDRLREALAPRGILVLSTVDAESWTSRLLGKRLEDFRRTREHLFFFGRETLREALGRHGFELLSVRSIGHTFELGFLLDRLALYNAPLFRALQRAVRAVGLASLQIYINPFTKMIAFARRRP
jgi:SAM-dependent methyltransferase